MPELSVSLTAAGSLYNIYRVVTAAQTTGVTLQGTGVAYKGGMSPNPSQIDILADSGNGGGRARADVPVSYPRRVVCS